VIQGRRLKEGRRLEATEDLYLVTMHLEDRARLAETLHVVMLAVENAILRCQLLPSRAAPLHDLLEALRQ
jgi:hypothetical protein